MDNLSLAVDWVTAVELSPPDLVRAAATAGCSYASVLAQAHSAFPDHRLSTSIEVRRATAQAMKECDVCIDMIELFLLDENADISGFRPAFECGEMLGASCANAIVRDNNEARRLDNLSKFCSMASEYKLRPLVEFVATSSLSSINSALEAIRQVGSPFLALEVDSLHMVRTGATAADVAAIDRRLIGRAQLNDGPLTSQLDPRFEATQQRQIPGTGEFPLREFLRALPGPIILGVEVPMADLVKQQISGAERVKRAVDGARAVLAQVQDL